MLGQVATLGRYKGIAELPGLKLRGFLGWFVARTYHLYALPQSAARSASSGLDRLAWLATTPAQEHLGRGMGAQMPPDRVRALLRSYLADLAADMQA